jgi:hypothetical protein
LSQIRQPGKHRRDYCSRDRALERHLRAARRQAARQTGVVSPRPHLCVYTPSPESGGLASPLSFSLFAPRVTHTVPFLPSIVIFIRSLHCFCKPDSACCCSCYCCRRRLLTHVTPFSPSVHYPMLRFCAVATSRSGGTTRQPQPRVGVRRGHSLSAYRRPRWPAADEPRLRLAQGARGPGPQRRRPLVGERRRSRVGHQNRRHALGCGHR